jgi:Ca-activated chloride channel family protein
MLNVSITPHREYLPADSPEQKLFIMLKLRPAHEVIAAQPSTAIAIVVDTSGSMDDKVPVPYQMSQPAKQTKRQIVMDSLINLIESGKLSADDRITLIQFDDTASTIIDLTPATEINKLKNAINALTGFSGGTYMAKGLQQAINLLSSQQMTNRRVLLFTDGATFDEDDCRELVQNFNTQNIPITALGVGADFNEDLLNNLSSAAAGRAFHIVTENAQGAAISINDLPKTIAEDFQLAKSEVITNLCLNAKTVQGVNLTRLMRAYPAYTELSLDQKPYRMGNVSANDETVLVLEFTIKQRPPSRMRIAQIGITYDVPGENRTGELPPQDLVVQFVSGEGFAVQVDPEVMHFVQQCNLDNLIQEATKVADTDPQKAEQLLENARRMTQRVGNAMMTESLSSAQDELRKTQQISNNTRKTIKMGSKGKTVKMQEDFNVSEEAIRKAIGD